MKNQKQEEMQYNEASIDADERHIPSVRLITHEISETINDYKARKKNHQSARWQSPCH